MLPTREEAMKLLQDGLSCNSGSWGKVAHCAEKLQVYDEKAYILGLLWADGYNDGKGKISISLQERDVDILKKIKKEIETDIPLNYRNFSNYRQGWKNQYRLFINSKYMSEKLNSYGMHPNKSLDAIYPDWIDEQLYPHFIRGYCDGDGHIGNGLISFTGSIHLIPKIKDYNFSLLPFSTYPKSFLKHQQSLISNPQLHYQHKE